MPNFCKNKVTISHHDKQKLKKVIDAFNCGQLFSSFIPINKVPDGNIVTECIKKWGTKWDVGLGITDELTTLNDNCIKISFQTAWTPPIEWYGHIIKEGFTINALYWEPFSCFAGIYSNEADIFYDLCTQNSVVVPEELDQEFKINVYLNQIGFKELQP